MSSNASRKRTKSQKSLTTKELRERHMLGLTQHGGRFLGETLDSGEPIFVRGYCPTISVGAPGTGKTTEGIAPQLVGPFAHRGGCIIIDCKPGENPPFPDHHRISAGEIYTLTSQARSKVGPVVTLDYSNVLAGIRATDICNPLAALMRVPTYAMSFTPADQQRAIEAERPTIINAYLGVLQQQSKADPFWTGGGADATKFAMMRRAELCDRQGGVPTIFEMRRMLADPDALLAEMRYVRDHEPNALSGQYVGQLLAAADAKVTFGGLMANANSLLRWGVGDVHGAFGRPERNGGESSFDVLDVLSRNGTIYVLCPIDQLHKDGLAPAVRLHLSYMLREIMQAPYKPASPVRVILDEAGNIGHLPEIKNALTMGRGAGIEPDLLFQTWTQIQAAYGADADTIISSVRAHVFYGASHAEKATLTRLVGESKIDVDKLVDMTLSARKLILLSGSSKPIEARKTPWFAHDAIRPHVGCLPPVEAVEAPVILPVIADAAPSCLPEFGPYEPIVLPVPSMMDCPEPKEWAQACVFATMAEAQPKGSAVLYDFVRVGSNEPGSPWARQFDVLVATPKGLVNVEVKGGIYSLDKGLRLNVRPTTEGEMHQDWITTGEAAARRLGWSRALKGGLAGDAKGLDKSPAVQAVSASTHLYERVFKEMGLKVPVRSILVFPHMATKPSIPSQGDLMVLAGPECTAEDLWKAVDACLANSQVELQADQLSKLMRVLAGDLPEDIMPTWYVEPTAREGLVMRGRAVLAEQAQEKAARSQYWSENLPQLARLAVDRLIEQRQADGIATPPSFQLLLDSLIRKRDCALLLGEAAEDWLKLDLTDRRLLADTRGMRALWRDELAPWANAAFPSAAPEPTEGGKAGRKGAFNASLQLMLDLAGASGVVVEKLDAKTLRQVVLAVRAMLANTGLDGEARSRISAALDRYQQTPAADRRNLIAAMLAEKAAV